MKEVYAYSVVDHSLIRSFRSAAEAASWVGCHPSSMSNWLVGTYRQPCDSLRTEFPELKEYRFSYSAPTSSGKYPFASARPKPTKASVPPKIIEVPGSLPGRELAAVRVVAVAVFCLLLVVLLFVAKLISL